MPFSAQAIDAHKRIIAGFRDGYPWAMLIAQMQSGKTETYLLAACENIRSGKVDEAIIFSGNAETDLRDQLKAELQMGSNFVRKYMAYILAQFPEETLLEDLPSVPKMIKDILNKITVVWGSELTKYSGRTERCLFIWEESHHAQNIRNRPDKFLKKIGVSADGDVSCLEAKKNYMLSVSATPFSELSDKHHHHQTKNIVYMEPGEGYNSVKNIRDSGRLHSFSVLEGGVEEAMNLPRTGKKYGLLRITTKNEFRMKTAIEERGWAWVMFDSKTKGEEKKLGERTWSGMGNAPEQDTVILLRGKCRMGKNLNKKHVLFVMETAWSSNTDTVLQGLLGRTCGYAEGSDSIHVYLHHSIVESGELDKYINMLEGLRYEIVTRQFPSRAQNITDERILHNGPISPLCFTRNRIKYPSNDRIDLIEDFKDALETGRVVNKNTEEVFDVVREKFMKEYTRDQTRQRGDRSNLQAWGLDDSKKSRNAAVGNRIRTAHQNGTTDRLGSGCGIDADGEEITLWYPKNIAGFDTEEVYVCSHVKLALLGGDEPSEVPRTNRREVFAHLLENGEEEVSNGGLTISLSAETADHVSDMQSELVELIQLWADRTAGGRPCGRCVSSNWDAQSKEFKGIVLTSTVLKSLERNGSIWSHVKARFQVELVLKKPPGKLSKADKEKGYLKLASISW